MAHCETVSDAEPTTDEVMEASKPGLASTLLEAPLEPPPPPTGLRRAWWLTTVLVGSLMFAYHGAVLIVWNTPYKAVGKTWHGQFMKYTQGTHYFRATGLQQSWSMFAPNPNRMNNFVRVLVTTQGGEMWDMDHDIYGKNRYPYVWYDRMGKINRRINGKKGYQRVYGAWICRQWEREHDELPQSVTFVRRYYRIPQPWDNTHRNGPLHLAYSPWKMPTEDVVQEKIECAKVEHGHNPPRLRERYGLGPVPEGAMKEPKIVTWWDRKQREEEAERRKAETEKRLQERRENAKRGVEDQPQAQARPMPLDAPMRQGHGGPDATIIQ